MPIGLHLTLTFVFQFAGKLLFSVNHHRIMTFRRCQRISPPRFVEVSLIVSGASVIAEKFLTAPVDAEMSHIEMTVMRIIVHARLCGCDDLFRVGKIAAHDYPVD